MAAMGRRGDELSEHILWVAKDVFLEFGFERTSMDIVAARAECSKRSLYAYYPSKEKLFIGVIELVRVMFLRKIKMPADYAADPIEAIVIFCARYAEILLFERSVQMCRVSVAEAAKFPEVGAHFYDAMLSEVQARLGAYIKESYKLKPAKAAEAAEFILAQVLHPRLIRALLGIDPVAAKFDEEGLGKDFDLAPIRSAVDKFVRLYTK
jgi:AcrR family transcriptional regulator